MIFIFNTTKKQLILKSVEKADRVVLNLVIPEMEVTHPLCHVTKEHKELADKILTSYKDGFEIKGDLSKRSATVENTVGFYSPDTNDFYNINMNEEFCRELYKKSPRNMIVIVTSKDGTIDVNDKNIVGQKTRYTFKQELSVHQFYLKWNDWYKLKFPVNIIVSESNEGYPVKLSTSSIKETNKAGREFNRNILKRSVIDPANEKEEKPVRSEKKPYNKPKYDKGNNQNQSKFSRGGKSSHETKNSIRSGSYNKQKKDGYSAGSNRKSNGRHNRRSQ